METQTNVTSGITTSQQIQRQRLTKIKPSANSFRLGQDKAASTPAPSGKQREFRFHVPSAAELGNGEEAIKVFTIAHSLNESSIGQIAKLTIEHATWVIHFRLSPTAEVANEDQYLSDISRQLLPLVNQLSELKTGFQRGKGSTWEYCIGDFIAAEGDL